MMYESATTNVLATSEPPPRLPSRYDNPFATCWCRPGAIPFHFSAGQDATQLVTQLASASWRGAIIGPHGSGKSTLLETLKPRLRNAGRALHAITLRNAQRRLPSDFYPAQRDAPALLIIDGYEQLNWLERWRLARHCRRTDHGLLVTSHTATRLPTLISLTPGEPLVQQIVADLASRVSTSVSPADIAASHACHGSNVREILFDLYDRHERRRRSASQALYGATLADDIAAHAPAAAG